MKLVRAHVVIHGFVQGVAFRANTRSKAERLGLGGWVRNLPDGTVEALFEGEEKNVEEAVAWCHTGPYGARVTTVEITREQPRGEHLHFDIRHDI